jgi:quinone-modifying oxidoreductase subunit QmoC
MIPFFARIASDAKLLPILFAIPMALFYVILVAIGNTDITNIPRAEGDVMAYHKMVPVPIIDTVFILTAIFAAASAFVGIKRLWNGMKAQAGQIPSSGSLTGDIVASITEILGHSKFADCTVNRTRQWGHMLLFYAFAGLTVVTMWAVGYLYGHELFGIQAFGPFHFGESPYPNSDPVKILALASSIAFAAGVVILLMNRFAQAGKAGIGSYFDWIFLALVIGVGATGMLSWALRLADMNAGYLLYYFHLVFIWSLFAYAPYSKFAHLFYRTTAMVFARRSGRDKK